VSLPMMKPHHFVTRIESEQERAEFREAGVQFSSTVNTPRGEVVTFDIAEDDPRWEKVLLLLRKRLLAQAADLAKTMPSSEKSAGSTSEGMQAPGLNWLDQYSGQTVEQLISLEGKYRIDSLVLAFEQAISQKAAREGARSLTGEERIVLAVEALEREVNNGGYDQFFANSSREFAAMIVDSLRRIGCKKTASITQKAIKALGVSHLTAEAIETAMAAENEQRLERLSRCDEAYYQNTEPIAERLFTFVKANKSAIKL
jgi:uncharacterized protein DUF4375